MSKFLKISLNRACYVSLLNIENATRGILEYKNYVKRLNLYALNPFFFLKVLKEKKQAKIVFVDKMKTIAKKFFDEKKYTEAQSAYQAIFEANDKDIENIKNYITCLEHLEQFDLQLKLALHLISVEKNADNYKILSSAYNKNSDYKKAEECYEKYFKLSGRAKMNDADYNSIGCYHFNMYVKNGQNPYDARYALECYEKALQTLPKNKAYLKNAIVAAMKCKDFKAEKRHWKTYMDAGYMTKDDEFTYSASCMRNGDIKTWAKYYDSRFEKTGPTVFPKLDKPLYTGQEDLSKKTLLVHSEQGFGDNFLMFGYMPRLVKKAKKVIYYIQNNAYELVKNNRFGVEVYCQNIIDVKKLKYDYYVPSMSLPIVLGLDKDDISVEGGYIDPIPALVNEYKEKYFNNDKFKIGIAFRGVAANAKRDIPLKNLATLDKLKNVQLYCFTKDIKDEELKVFKKNKVINLAKKFENFAHTAAAMENCDLLIASDNGVLNLGGAIGKKAFGVFNYHYEFRWYDLTGDDCGWYRNVKPFINDESDDWNKTLLRVIKEVELLQKASD